MEKQKVEQREIYCEDDEHFQKGHKIKYLMVKKDKGSIVRRLFCDDCYLGKYNSFQQYCCDIEELINGNIYEAFKYTKFDSDKKQEFFNYIRNHYPYLNEQYIKNMISRLLEEFKSQLEDLEKKLLEQNSIYTEDVKKWPGNDQIIQYFNCEDLRQKLIDLEFQRSPKKFEELNKAAEDYVCQINNEDKFKVDIEKIISAQKHFFNLDRYNLSFEEVMQSVQNMNEKTFSSYQFSQSILTTPYIETIIEKNSIGNKESFIKNMKLIYRMTKHGANYQTIQKIPNLENRDTITIVQTKNKSIFGVLNYVSNPQKSLLFQMNKEKYFLLNLNKKALQLNLNSNLSSWILKFGEEDIIINSTFTKCTSNLGTGFDISGSNIFDKQEYIADCLLFDIFDIEIFEIPKPQNLDQQRNTLPPSFINIDTTRLTNQPGQPIGFVPPTDPRRTQFGPGSNIYLPNNSLPSFPQNSFPTDGLPKK